MGREGRFRIRDHIGMISGLVLGLFVLVLLVILAFAGDPSASGILIVAVVGIVLVVVGVQLQGPRRR
jgi:uncharacterized membrane protein HdeD (DUF308 family)